MHELSIAYSIVEIVKNEAEKANSIKVSEIELVVGTLSGIEVEALEFAMEVSIKNSIMENAKVKIIQKKAMAICKKCNFDFAITSLFDPCPNCGRFENEVYQGQEMLVKSLVVE